MVFVLPHLQELGSPRLTLLTQPTDFRMHPHVFSGSFMVPLAVRTCRGVSFSGSAAGGRDQAQRMRDLVQRRRRDRQLRVMGPSGEHHYACVCIFGEGTHEAPHVARLHVDAVCDRFDHLRAQALLLHRFYRVVAEFIHQRWCVLLEMELPEFAFDGGGGGCGGGGGGNPFVGLGEGFHEGPLVARLHPHFVSDRSDLLRA
eukprot:scaffold20748_cov56-Phaeocystis_antarctica.AAC.4